MPVASFQTLLDPANLTRIAPFSLLAKIAVEGFLSGLHRSIFHGFGSEFLQYRHYTPGEDLKYVDWKLFARRDRLYTKVFQEETNMNVHLLVDISASMGYAGDRAVCSKLRYATMIAASLAYLAARQGDNIGLMLYGGQVLDHHRPAHRAQQLHRVLLALARAEATGEADHHTALGILENQISTRGLVILLSDMLESEEDLPKRLGRLRLRHCDCIGIQILDPDETNLPRRATARFEGMEGSGEVLTSPAAVAEAHDTGMETFLHNLRRNFHREQVDYLQLSTRENLGHALAAYLHHREKLR